MRYRFEYEYPNRLTLLGSRWFEKHTLGDSIRMFKPQRIKRIA